MSTARMRQAVSDALLGFREMGPDALADWEGYYRVSLATLDSDIAEDLPGMTREELERLSPTMLLHVAERGLDQPIPAAELRESTRAFLAEHLAALGRERARRDYAVAQGVTLAERRYTDDFLADLKRRVNLDGLLEHEAGVALGRRSPGGSRRGLCPFCRSAPDAQAFAVYLQDPDAERFVCFKCGARGNAITAIMLIYGVGFRPAVEILAAKCGLAPPEPPRPTPSPEQDRFLRAARGAARA